MHFNGPFLYRSSFNAETEQQESERALDYLDRLIQHEGSDSIAAIILESVPGTAGIMVPHPVTWPGSGRSATATASCSSPTR